MTNKGNVIENIFKPHDFVYFKSGDTIESSGYKINSILMNHNIPAMVTDNKPSNTTNVHQVSNLLNNFAVPAGLLLLQQKSLKHYDNYNVNDNNDVINDDLFDKLLELSTPTKKKKLTKRHKSRKNIKKTKRKYK